MEKRKRHFPFPRKKPALEEVKKTKPGTAQTVRPALEKITRWPWPIGARRGLEMGNTEQDGRVIFSKASGLDTGLFLMGQIWGQVADNLLDYIPKDLDYFTKKI